MEASKTFETSMTRLEEIVKKMERGDVPLEEALRLFEEGTGLIKKCSAALDQAEQKVEMLVKTPEGPETEPFQVPEE